MKTYRELTERSETGIKGKANYNSLLGGIEFDAPGRNIVIFVDEKDVKKMMGGQSVKAKADITN